MDLNMKILVVDDFATMRKVIRNMLRQLGCENVSEAENGEEGFRMARTDDFGLIVSDWNMPVMSGLEFLKVVRSEEKTKNTPFLMIFIPVRRPRLHRPRAQQPPQAPPPLRAPAATHRLPSCNPLA